MGDVQSLKIMLDTIIDDMMIMNKDKDGDESFPSSSSSKTIGNIVGDPTNDQALVNRRASSDDKETVQYLSSVPVTGKFLVS